VGGGLTASAAFSWVLKEHEPCTWAEVCLCSALCPVGLPRLPWTCLDTDVSGGSWAVTEPVAITGYALLGSLSPGTAPVHATLPAGRAVTPARCPRAVPFPLPLLSTAADTALRKGRRRRQFQRASINATLLLELSASFPARAGISYQL